MTRSTIVSLLAASLLGVTTTVAFCQEAAPQPEAPAKIVPTRPMTSMEKLRREASRLRPVVGQDGTRMMLFAASWLPVVKDRTIMYNPTTREAMSIPEYKLAAPERQTGFAEQVLDQDFYYFTRYGSPLAYARPIDLIAALEPGVKNPFRGKRLLDYGFGSIGHLRLLALLGADVVGVEVDPVLKALYSEPEDTGPVAAAVSMGADVSDGNLRLVYGKWPGEVREETGGEFDLIVSKNVLKRGYIHPAQPIDERMQVKLGVSDEDFVKALHASLKPGGIVMIYNIHPKQKDLPKDYMPWADGRCPFAKELLESVGFEVVEFDKDDSEGIRPIAKALRWDEGDGAMDIQGDLFATYTLLRRKAGH
ncbi:MAG: class I SAM-dependent methyltransferase [Phycisphaerales bacterium]